MDDQRRPTGPGEPPSPAPQGPWGPESPATPGPAGPAPAEPGAGSPLGPPDPEQGPRGGSGGDPFAAPHDPSPYRLPGAPASPSPAESPFGSSPDPAGPRYSASGGAAHGPASPGEAAAPEHTAHLGGPAASSAAESGAGHAAGTGEGHTGAPAGTEPPGSPPVPPGAYSGPAEQPAPRRRSRRGLVIGVISAVVVLALIGGGVSWYVLTMPQPEDTADAYAAAWSEGDYAAMADLATGEGDPAAAYKRLEENLGIENAAVTTGPVTEDGDTASVPFEATLTLSNAGEWAYDGTLPLVRADGEWRVDFSPAVIHPDLGEGQTLVRTNEWGERGHVLGADGSRLDESPSGSVQMIVGEVGTVTEDMLGDLGPAYEVGDPVGVSGVQSQYEERLAGTATTAVRVVDEGTAAGEVPEDAPTVGAIEGTDGKDVTLSIDPAVQEAAGQAIVDQTKPTAMVAIRPSTGEVLAAANVPGGFNRALEGQYPAGSIFKIVSYDALLSSGMGMDTPMDCPRNVTVGGQKYKNAGNAAYGAQSVLEAFATSCNTALVQQVADRLDGPALVESAEKFGFNEEIKAGLPVFEPSLPTPDSIPLLTASSIGQGQLLTSPLHMASVPAAVAEGSYRSPLLVTDPAPEGRPEPTPIDTAPQLQEMMRAVVTQGTAEDVGFTGEVHGKSGTAEYGTAEEGEELPAHGWFVGYEGDIAFAVVVEDGESGSGAAAPLAKKFLDAL
ncbi:hypothetical protein HNR12_000284 [Streptomonospora nanhaiensis]|uniref:Penicillin-binding protein n=1 Tax=Streptomonospora nanhaiensis TaxID=1323731 RepID=A0A853BHG9_9ACTN|nr:hypothetical protein [Streptomonospora nanhaiensis]